MLHHAFESRPDGDCAPHPDLNDASASKLIADAGDFVQRIAQLLASADAGGSNPDTDA